MILNVSLYPFDTVDDNGSTDEPVVTVRLSAAADDFLSDADASIDEPAVGLVNMEIPPAVVDDEVEFDNLDAANAEVSLAPMVVRNPSRPVIAPIPRKGDMAISPAEDTVRAARLVILRKAPDGVESVCARVLDMTPEVRIALVLPPSTEGGWRVLPNDEEG
jgi:hypothetical protein